MGGTLLGLQGGQVDSSVRRHVLMGGTLLGLQGGQVDSSLRRLGWRCWVS